MLRYVAILLVVMQAAGFVSTLLTTNLSASELETLLMADGQFELSDKHNTVVFLLDTADADIVEKALAQYPELPELLSGFTYYPDATSAYSRTFPGVTYMLTGERYYFNEPTDVYVDRAFTKAPMLRDMAAQGVDVRLFTSDMGLIGNAAKDIINNTTDYQYSRLENISLEGLVEGMLYMSLYKAAPYQYKEEYEYGDASDINELVMKVEEYYYNDLDCDFYIDLLDHEITVNSDYKSAFRFYHLWGCHPGICWDAELDYEEERTVPFEEGLRGSFKMIEEYINQLEAQGILDETTIIITADHGYSGGGQTLDVPAPARPITMIKPAHADMSREMIVSKAPVCHEDLFATYMQGLGLDGSAYGRSLTEIQEGEERQRYYYYTALRSDEEGEVALREYLLEGDAANLENYKPTGAWWDVAYSRNAISDEDFQAVLDAREAE